MDIIQNTFFAALKAALQGKQVEEIGTLSREEWQQVLKMATLHRVLPLIYEAVYPVLAKDDASLAVTVRRQVLQHVIIQTVKTDAFLALNRELQANGVRPLVVKGIVCRALYPNPDLRASADEDVLVSAEQFAMAHQILLGYGMHTTQQDLENAYEIPYRKEGSPLYIELHRTLFPPESQAYGDFNRFFAMAHDAAILTEIQGNKIYTLTHTDHLFYLICHAFKHFLHSGFGIRQVCDITLFANHYGHQIDWMKILENCRQIRAERFTAALFEIGRQYLGFDPEMATYPEAWSSITVNAEPLLDDLLQAGLYGHASMSRKHSANVTLTAVSAQKQGEKGKKLAYLFPAPKKLENHYGYLKKYPWLVPVAWCSRVLRYFRETSSEEGNTLVQALEMGNKRVELMRIYGILE